MSSRVNQSDVFNAADELLLSGKYPTIILVREALGRGSNSTIQKHLAQWKIKHSNQVVSQQQEATPPDIIQNATTVFIRKVWSTARAEAGTLFDEQNKENEEQELANKASIDSLDKQVLEQKNSIISLEGKLKNTKIKLEAQEQANKALSQKLEAKSDSESLLQGRVAELERLLEDYKGLLSEAQSSLKSCQDDAARDRNKFEEREVNLNNDITELQRQLNKSASSKVTTNIKHRINR